MLNEWAPESDPYDKSTLHTNVVQSQISSREKGAQHTPYDRTAIGD